MNYKFYCYARCSTCQKAKKWLDEKHINYQEIDIKTTPPTKEWFLSAFENGQEFKKFFNTSGLLYKSLNIKDKLSSLSIDDIAELLSQNGMLVKRPLLISDKNILKGFKEDIWEKEVK